MKRNIAKAFALFAAVLLLSSTVLETSAHARAAGGRSIGSRGTRSYSTPGTTYRQSTPSQQSTPSPMQQPQMQQPSAGGGFLRSMAGGIAGGLLGGMLFRGLAGAGGMGYGGGGIGLFDILLLAGIGYLIYRMVRRRRGEAQLQSVSTGYGSQGYDAYQQSVPASYRVEEPARDDVQTGLSHLRQMDPGFDEGRFKDLVMDNFFKIQGGWMNRDLQALSPLLTPEMQGVFREDIERLLREGRVNRLENIAVRSVELAEVWQEAGQDYVTALIYANLLDYTTDERGSVLEGSKTEPVKFEEYWTFTRPVGNNSWRLAAINQK
ncbi:Tim44 domain-containing protein [Geomonas sp. Red69]|uniref:Tim44 domain-containing protein n=1 Tax=Geomonas diazotrophica TaxID=2843197 RepID=A0ABX8JK12_9BACT|nr:MULTISPECIES: Tim44 domain-containing protein [Geomonas]MBU5638712.1 Tim44 domain-containing protein [Geomonas diazotrophica]QWV98710.1 Tim44 domain-containing protein [Geomonas nitrogeniifigens]QXE87867.1 Tim44 domain-containing protein [Geomonas nitrogeniifigens]